MEINITKFFREAPHKDYSASQAEGGYSAGRDTWEAAWNDANQYNLLDADDKREAMRVWMLNSGGWDAGEIAQHTDRDLNALFMQLVSGDIRDAKLNVAEPDWGAYEAEATAGRLAGRLYRADDGEIFYSLGD